MHNDNIDTSSREENAKAWCEKKGIEFLGMSKDGERFKGVETGASVSNYKFTLYNYEYRVGRFQNRTDKQMVAADLLDGMDYTASGNGIEIEN